MSLKPDTSRDELKVVGQTITENDAVSGLDGFWIHRVLQAEGVESNVVDLASVATSRRRRRAKSDKIDGEALVRALLAYKRGEPRVCAIVRVPTPEAEDVRGGKSNPCHHRAPALGISSNYAQRGMPLDRKDRAIATVLAGIRNTNAAIPRQKAAVLPEHLIAMLETLDPAQRAGYATASCC